jgi:hypothetical protein
MLKVLDRKTLVARLARSNVAKVVSELSRLPKRKGFKGNPDDILHMDWLAEWSATK